MILEAELVNLKSDKKTILFSPFPPYDKRYKLTPISIDEFEKRENISWGDKIVTKNSIIQSECDNKSKLDHPLVTQYLKNPPVMLICQLTGRSGMGAFAGQRIKKGTVLGIYPGELSVKSKMEIFSNQSNSDYVLTMAANNFEFTKNNQIDNLRVFFIDSLRMRNVISYFQHLPKNNKAVVTKMQFSNTLVLPGEVALANVEFETVIHNGCPLKIALASSDIEENEMIGFDYESTISHSFTFFTKFGEDLTFYDLGPALRALNDTDKTITEAERFEFIFIGLARTHYSLLNELQPSHITDIKSAIIRSCNKYEEKYRISKDNCALRNLHKLSNKTYDKNDPELSLRQAAANDDLFMLLYFLHLRIDVNSSGKKTEKNPTPSGKTALHFSLENGNYGIAQLLVFFGADINILDTNGKTPLDLIPANKNIPRELSDIIKLKKITTVENALTNLDVGM